MSVSAVQDAIDAEEGVSIWPSGRMAKDCERYRERAGTEKCVNPLRCERCYPRKAVWMPFKAELVEP